MLTIKGSDHLVDVSEVNAQEFTDGYRAGEANRRFIERSEMDTWSVSYLIGFYKGVESTIDPDDDPEPDGAPCCPMHSSNLGSRCDFPGYAANH